MRGSTFRAYAFPFTFSLTGIFSMVSGIDVADLDFLTPSASGCNLDCALYQRHHQRSLVPSRTAHVRLWISGSPGSFRRGGDGFIGKLLPAEFGFGSGRLNGSKADTAEHDGSLFAYVAFHCNTDRSTRCGIHGSSTFEREVGGAGSFRRNLHCDFAYQFVMREYGRISVGDELIHRDRAFPFG